MVGIYAQYLDANFSSFQDITAARKEQLKRISARRGRDVLVYAAAMEKGNAAISIEYQDLMAVQDQLSNLGGEALDLLLETPGGSGEVAEDIVRLLRERYDDVAIIVPGYCKSAGTMMAMAGDELLMGPLSALGPIDAQLTYQGKTFSAEAMIEGLEKIKAEVVETGSLNKAYIPILQGINPGEIERAKNAQAFARRLVRDWLAHYKFRKWFNHSSNGEPVTDDDRSQRADEIAEHLSAHSEWLTHYRSIKIADLQRLRLLVTDYREDGELADAIQRYYTLLRMTFEQTQIYKVFETPETQIYRHLVPQAGMVQQPRKGQPQKGVIEVKCANCGTVSKIQVNMGTQFPLDPGLHPFPNDNQFECPNCGSMLDLTEPRRKIEAQAQLPIVL